MFKVSVLQLYYNTLYYNSLYVTRNAKRRSDKANRKGPRNDLDKHVSQAVQSEPVSNAGSAPQPQRSNWRQSNQSSENKSATNAPTEQKPLRKFVS